MHGFPLALVCCSLLLAACTASVPEPSAAGGRMEWQGLQGCADCDAIDTVLVLSRNGGERRFEMIETYLLGTGGEPFVDSGAWESDDALIRLQGDDGSSRTYAVLGDGRLQSRRIDGSREAHAHVLQPVAEYAP